MTLAVGVDSCSFAWRGCGDEAWEHLRLAGQRGWLAWPPDEPFERRSGVRLQPSARRSYLLEKPVAGSRAGFYPEHRLIYSEGRAALAVPELANSAGLVDLASLPEAAFQIAATLSTFGIPLIAGPEPTVRRLDLAADLNFARPAEGLDFLRTAARLELPKRKRNVWSAADRAETVYFRTVRQGRVRLRIYDKAAESGGVPGSRIRIERQLRYPKAAQLTCEQLAANDAGKLWAEEIRPWLDLDEPFATANPDGAASAVLASLDAGTINAQAAERLLGYLALRRDGRDGSWWKAQGVGHTHYRRTQELQALGVALSSTGHPSPQYEPLSASFSALLRALLDAWPAAS